VAGKLLLLIEDLIFVAKVRETAKALGIELAAGNTRLSGADVATVQPQAILIDLNPSQPAILEWIRALKTDPTTREIPMVAFASHVQSELIARARAAGCDRVLARSAFSQQLPALLRELSAKDQ